MKIFGRKSAGREVSRPVLSRGFASWASAGTGDGQGDWPRSYEAQVSVSYRAGLASGWSAIPEPLRQGIVLRAAEIYAARDTAPTSPSTEVQALWRGSRRLRLI